jgi:hypothetical protein
LYFHLVHHGLQMPPQAKIKWGDDWRPLRDHCDQSNDLETASLTNGARKYHTFESLCIIQATCQGGFPSVASYRISNDSILSVDSKSQQIIRRFNVVNGRVRTHLSLVKKKALSWVDDMFWPQCWAIIRSRRNIL